MENASFECPLCCKEKFTSIHHLRNHIFDIQKRLKCPECKNKFSDLNLLALHLAKCPKNENNSIGEEDACLASELNCSPELEDHQNAIPIDEIKNENLEGTTPEDNQFYCEICNVTFLEMKEHLMEYHMGQEVIVESENLENVMNESEVDNDQGDSSSDTTPDVHPPSQSDSEQIFLEEEELDATGRFFTKKFTKINIVQSTPSNKSPIIENIYFHNGQPKIFEEEKMENVNTVKVYRCEDCNLRFAQISNYNNHDCNSRQGEVCEICLIHFATKGALTFHKRKLHGELKPSTKGKLKSSCKCNVCHIIFPSAKSMALHRKMHAPVVKPRKIDPPATYDIAGKTISEENNEMFTCHICGKEYHEQYQEVHMRSHDEELLNCAICNRKFEDKNDLRMHAQAHGNDNEKKISCGFCKKLFIDKKALTNHWENQCEGGKYACSFCGRRFSKPHEKVKHERIHTGQKPHVCEVCGKAFRVSYCLTLHLRTHSGIRPYHCDTCGKRFKSHSVFSHHLQSHSNFRPYKCPFCPKSFKTSVQLAGHKNTHTKPFSCTVCNRPFASLYAVRLHTQSHERENNLDYQCHICGAVYARNYALRDHLLTHPEITEKDLRRIPMNKFKKNKKVVVSEGVSENEDGERDVDDGTCDSEKDEGQKGLQQIK